MVRLAKIIIHNKKEGIHMFKNKKNDTYLFFCFVFIATILFLPNITPVYFGLLDDGVSIEVSKNFLLNHDYDYNTLIGSSSGRYVPTYWTYLILEYFFFGLNPLGYYLIHALCLGIVLFMIYKITHLLTKKHKISLLASILYLLSLPIVESYYTLGKPETQQALYLVFMLYFYLKTDKFLEKNKHAKIPRKLFALSIIPLFLLYFTKETSYALLPFSFFWMIFVWWNEKSHKTQRSKATTLFFAANIAAISLHQILKAVSSIASISEGGYSSMYQIASPKALFVGFGKWLTILIADNIAFLILTAILAFIILKKIKETGFKNTTLKRDEQMLVFFMLFSGFLTAVMIPWAILMDRYFLPAMIGTSIFVALFLNHSIKNKKSMLIKIAAFAIIINLLITLPVYATRMQVYSTWNQENGKLVDYISENTPTNGKIYVNLIQDHMYTGKGTHGIAVEIKLHMDLIKNRSDIKVHTYTGNETGGHIITMMGKNTKYFSRLGANDIEISNRYKLIPQEQKTIYESSKKFTMIAVDPFAVMNQYPLTELFKMIDQKLYEKSQKLNRSFIKIDEFRYGWEITSD